MCLKNRVKISLIIPCYNEEESIPLLISSCKRFAESRNIEIIIVNNGSSDGSKKLLEEYIHQYKFLRVVNIEKNQGYGNGIVEGLRHASGDILSWTHADLQTNPEDIMIGINLFEQSSNPEKLFLKGRRYGRPIVDTFFTIGMSFFETILMRTPMWDINAQPTMFHRTFFNSWELPPKDFSLDLYAYFMASIRQLEIKRFKVKFGERVYGMSHWNISYKEKYKFIKRTFIYSFILKKRLDSNDKN